MTHSLRSVRLVPIVLFAITCLLALKIVGLAFDGGYTLNEPAARDAEEADVTGVVGAPKRDEPALPKVRYEPKGQAKGQPKGAWAQQMFGFPDVTGSADASKAAPAPTDGAAKGDRTPVRTAQATAAVTPSATPPVG